MGTRTSGKKLQDRSRGYIVWDLTTMMRRRGIVHGPQSGRYPDDKPHMWALQKLTGLDYSTIHSLVMYPESVEGIMFHVLQRLCEVLECQPGDLMHYVKVSKPETPLADAYAEQTRQSERATPTEL